MYLFQYFNSLHVSSNLEPIIRRINYEGWNFNSGNYLFTTDAKQIHVSKFYCLQCSHQRCVQPVASDVEVVGYL